MQITVLERRGVPHHLLDVLPADAEFSAGHFYDLARGVIQDIVQVGPFYKCTSLSTCGNNAVPASCGNSALFDFP